MSLKLINESFEKMYKEAISPEAEADSKALKNIIRNHRDDAFSSITGRQPKEFSQEEKDVLAKHNLKYDASSNDIYPNEYEAGTNSYRNSKFGIADFVGQSKVDFTNVGRKRLQRVKAGTANDYHHFGKTSDEKQRLQKAVSDAKDDLAVYNRNGWKDDAKSAERSLKIRQGKLDKENQRLRDIRRKHSPLAQERERLANDMQKNLKDFKHSKSSLKWADERDADFRKDRDEETRRFMDRMKEIDKRVADNEERRQFHKDNIARLLRRK